MNSVRVIFAVLLALTSISSGIAQQQSAQQLSPAEQLPFVHPLFSDHMVLQCDKRVPVWGWSKPGEQVTVSVNGTTATATADANGKWVATIDPLEAGGPHELSISGPETITLTDVLVGDVWLCSGQSNMQWTVSNSNDAEKEIADADHANVRLFSVPRRLAMEPQQTIESEWKVCAPATIREFSAVAYFFGRALQEQLAVPIGLIHTSWGGTLAEAWTSGVALATLDDFQQAVDDQRKLAERMASGESEEDQPNQNVVTVLYNAMVAPLVPCGIRGAIWYQGEANANRPEQYRELLPTMIGDWRSRFNQGDFPFLIVQLANYREVQTEPVEEGSWAEIRESQALAAENDPHVEFAVISDIGEADDIHPRNKQDVGKRLSLLALKNAYGKGVVASGPTLDGWDVEGATIRVRFANLGGGLLASDGPLKGFAIADAVGPFVWATAVIDGDTVVLSAEGIASPQRARYNWANNPIGNLFNTEGLPAAPFRTDRPE